MRCDWCGKEIRGIGETHYCIKMQKRRERIDIAKWTVMVIAGIFIVAGLLGWILHWIEGV